MFTFKVKITLDGVTYDLTLQATDVYDALKTAGVRFQNRVRKYTSDRVYVVANTDFVSVARV